jgi:hypothetical protein
MEADCSIYRSGALPKILAASLGFLLAVPFFYLGYRYLRYNTKIAESRVVPPDAFFFSWGPKLFGSYTNSIPYLRFVVISQGIFFILLGSFFAYEGSATLRCLS